MKNKKEKTPPKKKRGRKPKIKTEEELKPKVKKKRGRKPKIKTAEELKPKVKKKRGRKPKHSVFKLGTIKSFKSKTTLDKSIIVHLPIKTNEIKLNEDFNKSILSYNPVLSIPQNNIQQNSKGTLIDSNLNILQNQNFMDNYKMINDNTENIENIENIF